MSEISKILIVGAGSVGTYISHLLQRERQEVVLIDSNKDNLAKVRDSLDVQTLLGHGADPAVLKKAGVEEADLVLAMTNVDEVNLLTGFTARQLGASRCVVRARSPWCLDASILNLSQALGIDLILNPEQLAAMEIIRFLAEPDAVVLTRFAHGRVQLRSFLIDEKSMFAGQQVRDLILPEDVLVAVVARNGAVTIPTGDTELAIGDRLTVIGTSDKLPHVQKLFHSPTERVRNVAIAGGGITGYFLAEVLEKRRYHVKVIESNRERCEYLSEQLDHAQIVHGDVTDMGFMKEERIDKSSVFIAVTGDDEDNLMSCLLAKELGVSQTATSLTRPEYASLVQRFGISLAVSPRHVMAEQVITLISHGRVRKIAYLEDGKVEVMELLAEHGSPMVGKPLAKLSLPEGALICAIVHLGRTIVPRGQDQIEPGDTVIVIGLSEAMDLLEPRFRGD